MTKTQRLRMPIDITMTILSIILMGGNYLFPTDIVHEILGVVLFLLWAVHITLNRRWYASLAQASKLITSTNANDRRSYSALFRGKYNARRILQTVINIAILICVVFLMISGIILSNHVFAFLGIESGLGFARTAHLLASHWYFLFMSLHIGLHVEMIAGKMKTPRNGFSSIFLRAIFILLSLYGIYAFIIRGIWRYLTLQQQFFFLDLERGYFLFALDYISIIVLFATVIHYLLKLKLRSSMTSS